jgi:hypothetical protein
MNYGRKPGIKKQKDSILRLLVEQVEPPKIILTRKMATGGISMALFG